MTRRESFWRAGIVVLCLVAAGLFSTDARFLTVQPRVLSNPTFEKGLAHWRANRRAVALEEAESRAAVLTVGDKTGYAYLNQFVP